MLPGSAGFDRRVERKQVGLPRNVGDGLNELTDRFRVRAQRFHGTSSMLHPLSDRHE